MSDISNLLIAFFGSCNILSCQPSVTVTSCFVTKLSGSVLPAKSDIDFMFCLQSYQGLIIDRSLVY